MTPNQLNHRRSAFTLVELLTVIFIISVLAAITVGVARSTVADSYTTVGAGDRLSQWLIIAKNRALRDRTPVGLRLIRDPNNPYFVREAQYIEMPVLWAPNLNPDAYVLGNPSGTVPPFLVVRYQQTPNGLLQEGPNPADVGVFVFGIDVRSFDVKEGDLLHLAELGSIHRIDNITQLTNAPAWYPTNVPGNLYPTVSAAFPCFKITLGRSIIPLRAGERYPPSPPNPQMLLPVTGVAPNGGDQASPYPASYPPISADNFYRTPYFGFFRGARPILGEPLVTLPKGMVVDMTPDRLASASPNYPVFRNPSFGLANINPIGTPLAANAPVPALPDVDILFAPSGHVMFTDSSLVAFWLRNETKVPPNTPLGGTPLLEGAPDPTNGYRFFDRPQMLAGGDSLLVAVYSKTGAIGTFPVFVSEPGTNRYYQNSGEDPYKFVRTAFNRGL